MMIITHPKKPVSIHNKCMHKHICNELNILHIYMLSSYGYMYCIWRSLLYVTMTVLILGLELIIEEVGSKDIIILNNIIIYGTLNITNRSRIDLS